MELHFLLVYQKECLFVLNNDAALNAIGSLKEVSGRKVLENTEAQ